MSEQKPRRGGCLTAFLLLNLIGGPLGLLLLLVLFFTVKQQPFVKQAFALVPGFSGLFVVGMAIAAGMAITAWVFTLAIWRWKRWGVYGFGAILLVQILFNLINLSIVSLLFQLVFAAIFFSLIRQRWQYMDRVSFVPRGLPTVPRGLPTRGGGAVTLFIDDASLRLMVADGKRIKQWADLSLEPGLIQNGLVTKEPEVVAKIKQLFEEQKVKDKKVMVGVNGLRCLTRPLVLPQLPEAMLDEAVRREAERVLPVPLDQLYISWQAIPAPEGKTQVFLVAIPRKTADDLFKALHQAGLKPTFMSLKPLLLARVLTEEKAVVVDVQADDFDLVIMTDGVPQPVRSIAFAEAALPWPEKLTVIKNELDRTITFFNSNNPEKSLAPTVPIFASGGLAKEPELCQSLSAELGHPVLPLPSPLACPEGLDLSRYAVNIGLVLQSEKKAAAPAVSLNALPLAYQPKPISLANILALPGAAIAAGLLAFLLILIQSTSADIDSMRDQLNADQVSLQRKTAEKQKLTKDIAELERQITEVETARDRFTAVQVSLEKQVARLNGDLEAATSGVPGTIALSRISHDNTMLIVSGWAPTVSGWAPNVNRVLAYLLALSASGRFGDIAVIGLPSLSDNKTDNTTRIISEGMDFVLFPSLQPPSKWMSSLETALGSLPTSLDVTSVMALEGTLTIEGWTPAENRLLAYLRGLEATGMFPEIHVTSIIKTKGGGMNFSVDFRLAALDEVRSAQKVLPGLEAGDLAAQDKADIQFAQEVFRYLESGDLAAEEIIDWENLKSGDTDVGAVYRVLPDEAKAVFRKAFIQEWSSISRATGLSFANYSNWRVQARGAVSITVAATAPDGKTTLLVYISVKDGKRVVSGWQ